MTFHAAFTGWINGRFTPRNLTEKALLVSWLAHIRENESASLETSVTVFQNTAGSWDLQAKEVKPGAGLIPSRNTAEFLLTQGEDESTAMVPADLRLILQKVESVHNRVFDEAHRRAEDEKTIPAKLKAGLTKEQAVASIRHQRRFEDFMKSRRENQQP